MTLHEHWKQSGKTRTEYAEWLGVPEATVKKWLGGGTVPSLDRMADIHKRTGGVVRIVDWDRARREFLARRGR